VIDESAIFVEDEKRLGLYTVQVLRQTARGWAPDIMQLQALVTNHRLLLKPFPRRYAPASIPAGYIKKVDNHQINHHRTVCLTLQTGHQLHIILNPRLMEHITDDLHAMIAPKPNFQFDEKVAKGHIERLISFFGGVDPFKSQN